MNYDPENIFAKILRGEIPCEKVFENNTSLAFKDINPQAPLHILVIPKGPYKSMDEFSKNATDKEIVGFIRAVGKVSVSSKHQAEHWTSRAPPSLFESFLYLNTPHIRAKSSH